MDKPKDILKRVFEIMISLTETKATNKYQIQVHRFERNDFFKSMFKLKDFQQLLLSLCYAVFHVISM